jgi:predicted DNA-binding protein (MmcQ/YjbR family)
MNPAELRNHCLSFSGAAETFPFGSNTSVFKVEGKMFALPGYHLNKRHWNTVVIDGSLSDDTIHDMIEDSYDLVVSKLPRARRRALGWRGDA